MLQTPTDSLDDYLLRAYRDDKLELERVRKILEEVWPVFTHSHTTKGWSYEVEEDAVGTPPSNFSFSTTAMILFAMGLGLGWIKRGPLAVIVPTPIDAKDVGEQKLKFIAGVNQLIENAPAGNPWMFKSGSFGFDDPLTLSWVLDLLSNPGVFEKSVDVTKLADFKERAIATAFKTVTRAFSNPSESCLEWEPNSGKTALDHVFPLLRAIQTFASLRTLKAGKDFNDLVKLAREKVRPFLLTRLHLHLSLATVPNSNFDAGELVFALEGLLLIDSHPRAIESSLLDRCFTVMAETQQRSPYWRPLKPFVTTQTGLALLPLSVEIANSLLRICKHLETDDDGDRYFTKYNSLFGRYSSWLFTRVARVRLLDGNEYVLGWHSEHVHAPRKIHPWETAQVAIFFLNYSELLQDHIARTSLTKANFSITKPARKKNMADATPAKYWETTWEKTEPLAGLPGGSKYRIYSEMRRKFIETHQDDDGVKDASGYFSMLLYGPPGTGKTTIAQELAKAFKWPLVTITPSDFIAQGEAEVEARAKGIFRTLVEQKNLVILFDEIDRMILDRDCLLYREQSDTFQFMTPSMLVKLKDLREAKRTLFLIATNYEERIDPAAKRVGRIDEKFLVAPADKKQRALIFQTLLEDNLDKVLGDNKTGRDTFMNELKAEQFKESVAASVLASYGELKNVVKEAIAKVDKTKWPSIKDVKEGLTSAQERVGPAAISLSNYRSRFNLDNKPEFGTVQKPLPEFLVLCHLKIENGSFTEEEAKLARAVMNHCLVTEKGFEADLKEAAENSKAKARVQTSLMTALPDETIVLSVLNHFVKA